MNPLAEMLAMWQELPLPERWCKVCVGGAGVTLQCGTMHAVAWNADETLVEIIYEQALHEKVRERVPPAVAVKLLLAIFRRERLCRVSIPKE